MNTTLLNNDNVKDWASRVQYWEQEVARCAKLLSDRLTANEDNELVESASSLLDNAIDGMQHANNVLHDIIVEEAN